MYKAIEVDVLPKTKPTNKKASFMVEDLLRSTRALSTNTTDCLPSQQLKIKRHCKPSIGLHSTVEDSRSTQTSSHDCSASRESAHYTQHDASSASSLSTTADLLPEQEQHLEKVFRLQQYLATKERQRLANTIQATDNQVKMWFQNKRRARKLQIDKEQLRQTKLAYLNSLAQSLLKTPHHPTSSPSIAKPSVRMCNSTKVPMSNCDYQLSSQYSRPQRVAPYSLNQNRYKLNSLPYVVPRVLPYCLQ